MSTEEEPTREVENDETIENDVRVKCTTKVLKAKLIENVEKWKGDKPIRQKSIEDTRTPEQRREGYQALDKLAATFPLRRRHAVYCKWNVVSLGNICIWTQKEIKKIIAEQQLTGRALEVMTELLANVEELAALCDEVYDVQVGLVKGQFPWSFTRVVELSLLSYSELLDGMCMKPLKRAQIEELKYCYNRGVESLNKKEKDGQLTPGLEKKLLNRLEHMSYLIDGAEKVHKLVCSMDKNFEKPRRVHFTDALDCEERFCKRDQ